MKIEIDPLHLAHIVRHNPNPNQCFREMLGKSQHSKGKIVFTVQWKNDNQ